MRSSIRSSARDLLSTLPGAGLISDRLMRRQHPIFMFHRILPEKEICYEPEMTTTPEMLDAFLGWLTQHYKVTPLPQLSRASPKGCSNGKPLCAVTFDDGWRDNYEHAFPILAKHSIPATIFVATGFVGTTRRFWQERLWRVIVAGAGNFDHEEIAEKLWTRFPWCPRLSSSDMNILSLKRLLMQCGSNDAEEFVSRLEEVTGERFPSDERSFLDWEQIDKMQKGGVDFGCHTHNHTLLTSVSPTVAYEEISRSKLELELHVNREIESFSYPWGRTASHITRQVSEAGFQCAVTTDVMSGSQDYPYLMSRIPVSGQTLAGESGTFEPSRSRMSFACSQLRAMKNRVQALQKSEMKKPLRLALIIDTIDSWNGGGTEGHIRHLLNALDRRYFEPQLFLLDPTPVKSEEIPCPVYVIGQEGGLRPVRAVRDLTRALKSFEPHIVQTFFPDATLFGTIAARRAHVPVIIHAERNLGHEMSRRDRILRKWLRKKVTGFQCNSRAIETILKNDVAQDRIEILPNHLNTKYFKPADAEARDRARNELGFSSNVPLFVLVANLRKVKDLTTCIEAAQLTREAIPAAHFVIIGEGDLRGELQQQINRLDLQERVQLVGIQHDVRPWLAAADIGILTSRSEGSSNAVLEYMATALPAVLSDIPANRELVDGLFFKTGDAADLAAQLNDLWESREKREIMGQNYCGIALRYGTSAFRERAQAYYVRLASCYAGGLY